MNLGRDFGIGNENFKINYSRQRGLEKEKFMAESGNELIARRDDLATLADGMDAQSRTRALERILSHYTAMRAETDALSLAVQSQSEKIAGLEKRVAAAEKTRSTSEPTKSIDENKVGASNDSAKKSEKQRRRRFLQF